MSAAKNPAPRPEIEFESARWRPSALGTPLQIAAERRVIQMLRSAKVLAARPEALELMRNSRVPAAQKDDARLEATLNHWLGQYGLKLAAEAMRPGFIWGTSLLPYSWFGHHFPGASTALDDPNSTYRVTGLDGKSRYVIYGRIPKRENTTLNFQLGEHVQGVAMKMVPGRKTGDRVVMMQTLVDDNMEIAEDGTFKITLDQSPADGRPNHLQLPIDGQLSLLARETFSDWDDVRSTELSIYELGDGRLPDPIERQIEEMARSMPSYAKSILDYLYTYDDYPIANENNEPHMRDGAYGFGAPQRFKLRDDEAIIFSMRDAGASYFGVQITDAWMNPLSPIDYLSTYSPPQSVRGSDGLFTYVLSKRDPHVENWVETADLEEGFFYLRWQGVPPDEIALGEFIQRFELVKFSDVEAHCDGTVDWPAKRETERAERGRQWRIRLRDPDSA